MSVTVAVVLDTRRLKIETGKYPVRLRITHQRKPVPYPTIFELSQEEFSKLDATRISESLQIVRNRLADLKRDAEDFIRRMGNFNFYTFEVEFVNKQKALKPKKIKKVPIVEQAADEFDFSSYHKRFTILKRADLIEGTILPTYVNLIKKMIQEERIGSALTYQESFNSIYRFKGNVRFSEINVTFLRQYEKHSLNNDCTKSTIGIKLRPLRAVFNEAIDVEKIISRDLYPFGKKKYKIPTGSNIKKALPNQHLNSLYEYDPPAEDERKALDFWFFSYFANGMNPKDIAHLKYKNIEGDYFSFYRAKTDSTISENHRPITVFLSDDLKEIIRKYAKQRQKS